MDPKLAALLARRKQKQEDEGDAGFYMQDDEMPPKSRETGADTAPSTAPQGEVPRMLVEGL
jgi:hypothetical protein